jgi:WD40 repeat protein
LEGHNEVVTSLVVLKENVIASSSSLDNKIIVWDVQNLVSIKTLLHVGSVTSIIVVQENRIAFCSLDKTIKIWSIDTEKCETTFKGHSKKISSLIALHDKKIATVSYDKTIKIWNYENYVFEKTFNCHGGAVSSLIALDDNKLASGSIYDKTVRIWNFETGISESTFPIRNTDVSVFLIPSDVVTESGSLFRKKKIKKVWNVVETQCTEANADYKTFCFINEKLPSQEILNEFNSYNIENISSWFANNSVVLIGTENGFVYCFKLVNT